MKHPSTRLVFDYWEQKRGQRLAPERSDIEPGPIRAALGDTFILGRDPRGGHHFRLAGTRLCALFCRELKGAPFIELWAASERDSMLRQVAAVSEESTGFVAGVTGRNMDRATIDLELLLLPLAHRDRNQARLLGVLAPLVAPYWLGANSVRDLTCGSVRHLSRDTLHVRAPRLVPISGNGRLRRGLVVYDGGRS
ncbi:MAG TPA: PAS domain-containing protein [Xanthobacteraceae bacterium]|nr:PAS domain-containing protein [Xanthobacteraceae bacterium]